MLREGRDVCCVHMGFICLLSHGLVWVRSFVQLERAWGMGAEGQAVGSACHPGASPPGCCSRTFTVQTPVVLGTPRPRAGTRACPALGPEWQSSLATVPTLGSCGFCLQFHFFKGCVCLCYGYIYISEKEIFDSLIHSPDGRFGEGWCRQTRSKELLGSSCRGAGP